MGKVKGVSFLQSKKKRRGTRKLILQSKINDEHSQRNLKQVNCVMFQALLQTVGLKESDSKIEERKHNELNMRRHLLDKQFTERRAKLTSGYLEFIKNCHKADLWSYDKRFQIKLTLIKWSENDKLPTEWTNDLAVVYMLNKLDLDPNITDSDFLIFYDVCLELKYPIQRRLINGSDRSEILSNLFKKYSCEHERNKINEFYLNINTEFVKELIYESYELLPVSVLNDAVGYKGNNAINLISIVAEQYGNKAPMNIFTLIINEQGDNAMQIIDHLYNHCGITGEDYFVFAFITTLREELLPYIKNLEFYLPMIATGVIYESVPHFLKIVKSNDRFNKIYKYVWKPYINVLLFNSGYNHVQETYKLLQQLDLLTLATISKEIKERWQLHE